MEQSENSVFLIVSCGLKSESHHNIEMFMTPHVLGVQCFDLYVCKSVGYSWFFGGTTPRKPLRSFQNE